MSYPTTIVLPNPVDADHLAEVKAEMLVLGAPTIRCSIDHAHGALVALEGSHRLTAAHQLGLEPMIVVLDDDAEITAAELGWDDMGWFDGEPAAVAAIRERMSEPMGMYGNAPILHFDDAWRFANEDAG